jgi:hypothetical protein
VAVNLEDYVNGVYYYKGYSYDRASDEEIINYLTFDKYPDECPYVLYTLTINPVYIKAT